MNDPAVVAAVQFAPDLMAVEKNLGVALQLTFEAAAKGARIIVLPELCLSGQVLRSVDEAADCCQEVDGYQTQAFVPICQRFNCHVVLGYVQLQDGLLYNSAVIIGPNGPVGNAQKHNLWGSDNMWATNGESISPVVITPVGRLGALVCRDVSNRYRASHPFGRQDERFYRQGSVDVVALLTNWGGDYGYPDSAWIELAEELQCNVVVANRTGRERDMRFKGGSCVVSRKGDVWTYGSSFEGSAVVGGLIL